MRKAKWQRVTHPKTGISAEIGRLTFLQKTTVGAMTVDVLGALAEAERATKNEQLAADQGGGAAAALRAAAEKLDAGLVEHLFEHKVRNVEGLETEEGSVTTGKELLEVMGEDLDFVIWALNAFIGSSSVSEQEGKASGSPSMSASSAALNSGSRAPSTGNAGGPSPSTATETRGEGASSSRVA